MVPRLWLFYLPGMYVAAQSVRMCDGGSATAVRVVKINNTTRLYLLPGTLYIRIVLVYSIQYTVPGVRRMDTMYASFSYVTHIIVCIFGTTDRGNGNTVVTILAHCPRHYRAVKKGCSLDFHSCNRGAYMRLCSARRFRPPYISKGRPVGLLVISALLSTWYVGRSNVQHRVLLTQKMDQRALRRGVPSFCSEKECIALQQYEC